jgi:hypothetical protein
LLPFVLKLKKTPSMANMSSTADYSTVRIAATQGEMNNAAAENRKGVLQANSPTATNEATTTTRPSQTINDSPSPGTLVADDSVATGRTSGIIDSALMSALRDGRERRVMLRLEQMLVEFMNDGHRPFLDVGPGGGNGAGPSPAAAAGGKVKTNINKNMSSSPLLLNPPKVQNNFQKLILHRLADRFGIVRESILSPTGSFNAYDFSGNSGPGPSMYPTHHNPMQHQHPQAPMMQQPPPQQQMQQTPFVIRLMKTAQSRIPKKLLIDILEEDDKNGNGNSSADSDVFDTRDMKQGLVEATEGGVAGSERREASTNAAAGPGAAGAGPDGKASTSGTAKPKNRKMKIMKRSENGGAAFQHERKTSSSSRKNNLRGKNLSDKEKAYAEARARIFAEEQQNTTNNNNSSTGTSAVGGGDSATDAASDNGSSLDLAPSEMRKTTNSSSGTFTPRNASPNSSCNSLSDMAGSAKSSPASARKGTGEPQDCSPLPPASGQDPNNKPALPPQRYLTANSPGTSFSEDDRQQQQQQRGGGNNKSRRSSGTSQNSSSVNNNNNSNNSSRHHNNSKVTWRNRREEENDPDFRRGRGVVPVAMTQSLPLPVNAMAMPGARMPLHQHPHGAMMAPPTGNYAVPPPVPLCNGSGSPAMGMGGGGYARRATYNGQQQQQQQSYPYSSPSALYGHPQQQQQHQQQVYAHASPQYYGGPVATVSPQQQQGSTYNNSNMAKGNVNVNAHQYRMSNNMPHTQPQQQGSGSVSAYNSNNYPPTHFQRQQQRQSWSPVTEENQRHMQQQYTQHQQQQQHPPQPTLQQRPQRSSGGHMPNGTTGTGNVYKNEFPALG